MDNQVVNADNLANLANLTENAVAARTPSPDTGLTFSSKPRREDLPALLHPSSTASTTS